MMGCTKGYIPQDIESNPPYNSDTITYESKIKDIISNNCISCHSGSSPQGNLLLENYNQVRSASENGTLIQRINDVSNPMPTTGLMPSSKRAFFDEWVQDAFLEN
jgi:hypothetical protein